MSGVAMLKNIFIATSFGVAVAAVDLPESYNPDFASNEDADGAISFVNVKDVRFVGQEPLPNKPILRYRSSLEAALPILLNNSQKVRIPVWRKPSCNVPVFGGICRSLKSTKPGYLIFNLEQWNERNGDVTVEWVNREDRTKVVKYKTHEGVDRTLLLRDLVFDGMGERDLTMILNPDLEERGHRIKKNADKNVRELEFSFDRSNFATQRAQYANDVIFSLQNSKSRHTVEEEDKAKGAAAANAAAAAANAAAAAANAAAAHAKKIAMQSEAAANVAATPVAMQSEAAANVAATRLQSATDAGPREYVKSPYAQEEPCEEGSDSDSADRFTTAEAEAEATSQEARGPVAANVPNVSSEEGSDSDSADRRASPVPVSQQSTTQDRVAPAADQDSGAEAEATTDRRRSNGSSRSLQGQMDVYDPNGREESEESEHPESEESEHQESKESEESCPSLDTTADFIEHEIKPFPVDGETPTWTDFRAQGNEFNRNCANKVWNLGLTIDHSVKVELGEYFSQEHNQGFLMTVQTSVIQKLFEKVHRPGFAHHMLKEWARAQAEAFVSNYKVEVYAFIERCKTSYDETKKAEDKELERCDREAIETVVRDMTTFITGDLDAETTERRHHVTKFGETLVSDEMDHYSMSNWTSHARPMFTARLKSIEAPLSDGAYRALLRDQESKVTPEKLRATWNSSEEKDKWVNKKAYQLFGKQALEPEISSNYFGENEQHRNKFAMEIKQLYKEAFAAVGHSDDRAKGEAQKLFSTYKNEAKKAALRELEKSCEDESGRGIGNLFVYENSQQGAVKLPWCVEQVKEIARDYLKHNLLEYFKEKKFDGMAYSGESKQVWDEKIWHGFADIFVAEMVPESDIFPESDNIGAWFKDAYVAAAAKATQQSIFQYTLTDLATHPSRENLYTLQHLFQDVKANAVADNFREVVHDSVARSMVSKLKVGLPGVSINPAYHFNELIEAKLFPKGRGQTAITEKAQDITHSMLKDHNIRTLYEEARKADEKLKRENAPLAHPSGAFRGSRRPKRDLQAEFEASTTRTAKGNPSQRQSTVFETTKPSFTRKHVLNAEAIAASKKPFYLADSINSHTSGEVRATNAHVFENPQNGQAALAAAPVTSTERGAAAATRAE